MIRHDEPIRFLTFCKSFGLLLFWLQASFLTFPFSKTRKTIKQRWSNKTRHEWTRENFFVVIWWFRNWSVIISCTSVGRNRTLFSMIKERCFLLQFLWIYTWVQCRYAFLCVLWELKTQTFKPHEMKQALSLANGLVRRVTATG